MSCIIAKIYNLTTDHIKPDTSAATDPKSAQMRPMNAQLDTSYSFQLINFTPIVNFEKSIKESLEDLI